MTNDEINPNDETRTAVVRVAVIRHSNFVIPSAFDIRHSSLPEAHIIRVHSRDSRVN